MADKDGNFIAKDYGIGNRRDSSADRFTGQQKISW